MKQRYVMENTHKEMRGLWYLVYSAVSLSLLIAMVFLPLAPAFADEVVADESVEITVPEESVPESDAVVGEEVEEPMATEEEPAMVEELATDTDIAIEEQSSSEVGNVVSDETIISTDSVAGNDVIDTTLEEESNSEQNEDGVSDAAESEEVDAGEEQEEIITDEQTEEAEDVATENSEEEESDTTNTESQDTEESTTTVDENIVVVNTLTNNDNKFSFAENECTTAGDGTFYCVKSDAVAEVTHTDRIFAAVDAEGDKEIFVEKNGELSPLTTNQYDDDAPYYDELSNTAVWHRLIDGRYQIISFDFDKEKETQLTNDRYNNMEPYRFGDIIVWQGWVGNDWEIFLLEDDELTMLTDNTTHDITPGVNGTHVVWQSFENNTWVMKVYDIHSKVTTTIDDDAGGSIENPRFVLIYDSKQDTGDIETRGYDLESGKVIALGSAPVNLPEEIPDPDQTGEKRALVTITQLKPKTEDEGGDEPLPDAVGTSTPNGIDDIVILSTDTGSSIPEVTTDDVLPSENDVVITSFDTGTTSDTSHIEDIIITPYIDTIATSTDAQ